MARKNGNVKEGVRQRRGNNKGTLFRRKKSGKEYGCYFMRFSERTPEGKRVRTILPTHTNSLEAAREALNAKAEELGFGSDDTKHLNALLKAKTAIDNAHALKEQKAKEAAEKQKQEEQAAAAAAAEQELIAKSIDIQSAFTYYRASKRRPDSSDTTLRGYESQCKIFTDWVSENHPTCKLLRDITPEIAESFLDHLEKTRSRNTRNKYLIFLRTLWRVLRWEKDAHLLIDPWDGIKSLIITPDQVQHKPLTIEELGRVAHVLVGNDPIPGCRILDASRFNGMDIRNELRVLFAIGIYTGLRLGDCATLSWGSVDLAKGVIDTIPLKTKRKYNRRVIIPIHQALAVILEEQHQISGKKKHVLPTVATMYSVEPTNVTNRTQAVFRAAKIDTCADAPEGGDKKRTLVGFHSLRHTFASIMLNAGAHYAHVEKMLGHSSVSMTANYFHENAQALANNIALLPVVRGLLPPSAAESFSLPLTTQPGEVHANAAMMTGIENELAKLVSKGDKNGVMKLLKQKLATMQ